MNDQEIVALATEKKRSRQYCVPISKDMKYVHIEGTGPVALNWADQPEVK